MQVDNVTRLLYAVSNVEGSSKQLEFLLERFESLENLANADLNEINDYAGLLRGEFVNKLVQELRKPDLIQNLEHYARTGIHYLPKTSQLYPEQLLDLEDHPVGLFYRGNPELLSTLSVAIVGTRKSTKYGKEQATQLGLKLASMGITLVSGLAVGIDTAAHSGSLETQGDNIAVLGSGVEQTLTEQKELYSRIIAGGGCIVSEYPVGFRATHWSFPRRNRIIAALALATVVIEAPLKSGALITARYALELGREVLAMPGPITYESFHGCHNLIRHGALVYESVNDVTSALRLDDSVLLMLKSEPAAHSQSAAPAIQPDEQKKKAAEMFGIFEPRRNAERSIVEPGKSVIKAADIKKLPTSCQQGYPDLTEEEKNTLVQISYEMTHINDLVKELKLTVSKVSAILTMLEISGYVRTMSGGFFKRIA